MEISLKTITPNIENTIVEIARVSSSRSDKSEAPENLINYLIKNHHWSPFEHGFITIEVVTSRGIAAQLLRHRSNFFQEFSQRYQDVKHVSKEGIFEPIEFRWQAKENRQSSEGIIGEIYLAHDNTYVRYSDDIESEDMELLSRAHDLLYTSETLYNEMIERGWAKETARFILPLATRTRLFITMNIRSVIHWLDLREDGHAQKEVRIIANEFKEIFKSQCPVISSARGYLK